MSYDPFARGPYPVGVRTISLEDESRAGRAISVELWYPATASYEGMDLESGTCDRFEIAPGVPEKWQLAVRAAEPSDGHYPLILYSHCAASHRRDAALLATHLASHGYVLAAPDHPGDTTGEVLADAAAMESRAARRRASDEDTLANRPQDAIFTIHRVLEGAAPATTAIIDRDRIATCGVSLGGWTGLRVNSLDRRSKATFFAVLRGASHFHWAEGAEQQYEALRKMWESGAISVPGTDVVALASATPPFSQLCPNWHGTEALQVLCLAHMDAALKGNSDARAFLDGDLISAFATRGISLEEVTQCWQQHR